VVDHDIEPDSGVEVDVAGAGLGVDHRQPVEAAEVEIVELACLETEVSGDAMELVGEFPQCSGGCDGVRIRCVLDNDEHAARTVENG